MIAPEPVVVSARALLTPAPQPREHRPGLVAACGMYLTIAGVVAIVTAAAAIALPAYHHHLSVTPGRGSWWRVWENWDGGWYLRIAESGYGAARGSQSSVAFFPAYPAVVRLETLLTGSAIASGVATTILSGLAVAALFGAWLRDRLSRVAAILAVLALFVFPYAFYLYGPLYADALFLACAIGAFVALERGNLWVAALAGAVATAARPVGFVVVIGLVARTWELTGPSAPPEWRGALRSRGRALACVSVSAAGLAAYSAYLWVVRSDPFAFVSAERGWHQSQGPSTWMKTALFVHLERAPNVETVLRLAAHPVVMVAALALIPLVVRRFGRAYGVYAALAVLLPAVATKDFFGMGRYVLAAFPCFGAAGVVLAEHRRLRGLVLAGSAALLLLLASQFGRGAYVS